MMASLYLYFGWIGIASILLWMLSALIALNYAGHPFRNTYFARALAVLFAAWLFALANSGNVDRIEVDQTSEIRALEERRKTEIQQLQERAAKVRYAEDDKLDALDLAGIQNASSLSVYERALLSKGIKPRKAGAKKSGGKPEEELTLAGAEEVSAFDESADEGVKRLPMNEVLAAASLDSMNRWAIRIIAILILLAMLHDYLRRFNQTASAPFPLPIGSQALDALFPKAHSTALRAREPGLVRDFLALVTRKGEPFIYFGAADIVGTQALPRLYLPFFEFPRLLANAFSTRRVGSPKACALKKKIMRWLAVPFAAIGILLRFAGGFLLRGFHALLRILPSWARQSNHATRRLKHHATIASSRLRVFARNLARGFVSEFPMPVISLAPGQSNVSETFVFESAWFRRYSFVVQGIEEARSHIAFLHDFLDARFHPNAAARPPAFASRTRGPSGGRRPPACSRAGRACRRARQSPQAACRRANIRAHTLRPAGAVCSQAARGSLCRRLLSCAAAAPGPARAARALPSSCHRAAYTGGAGRGCRRLRQRTRKDRMRLSCAPAVPRHQTIAARGRIASPAARLRRHPVSGRRQARRRQARGARRRHA